MTPPVFLSASEPYPARAREYFESQNLANIRAAIRALCAHVLPHQPLVFGGHPAITPLVRGIAERIHHDRQRSDADAPPPHVVMFMCRRFLPLDEEPGPGVVVTDTHDREGNVVDPARWARNMSLLRMRYEMLGMPGAAISAPTLRRFSTEFGARRFRRRGVRRWDGGRGARISHLPQLPPPHPGLCHGKHRCRGGAAAAGIG